MVQEDLVVLQDMSFVFPQFFFGLLALGIPIIIHLFNFRKSKKVYFSNSIFLFNLKKAASTKLKVKHLLILLSRLLFILFLVLTFTQPFIPAKEDAIKGNQAIIYLDNSYSMSNEVTQDLSAFEASLDHIKAIINAYPQNSKFLLITNDFAPFSNTYKIKNEILEIITEIDLTGISRNMNEVMFRIKNTEGVSFSDNIYWLSDFQKSTAGDYSTFLNDTTYNKFLIPLYFEITANVYFDSLYLSNPFLIQSERNQLNVSLRNDGDQEIEDLMIKLFINDVQLANGSVNINPFSTSQISFDIRSGLDQFNYGRISFEDFPVVFDNDFFFSLTLSDRISIIEINDLDSSTVIEKVYGNNKVFNYRSYHYSNIDFNDLKNANIIILNEVGALDKVLYTALSQFNEEIGDLMIIPSNEIDLDSYGTFSNTLTMIPDSVQVQNSLSALDLANPFFTDIFESTDSRFNMPFAKAVLDISLMDENIIKIKDGLNYLSSRNRRNKLYVLASPLDDDYSNFQNHAVFVPVMYRIAMLSKKEFSKIYYGLNDPVISVMIDSVNRESIVKLRSGEKEIIPVSRWSGNELIMEIPKFEMDPGNYHIVSGNQEKGILAFNQDKNESLLEQLNQETLENLINENSYVKLFNTKGINNFENEIKEQYIGTPLWRYMLILALFFLLAEILFIRFL